MFQFLFLQLTHVLAVQKGNGGVSMFNMLKNVIENLFSKPATRKYPFDKREPFANARGRISGIEIDKCIFCGICNRKCPADALIVNKIEKSWEIDPFKCVIGGLCVEVCPKKCILMDGIHPLVGIVKEKQKFIQEEKHKEEKITA